MRKIQLGKSGEYIPVIGQCIRNLDRIRINYNYVELVKRAIEYGLSHIELEINNPDKTAKEILREIIKIYGRDNLFLSGKSTPRMFRAQKLEENIKHYIEKMSIEYFDLLVFFKKNPLISIKKCMKILDNLVKSGLIKYIGVANFSKDEFEQAQSFLNQQIIVSNQFKASIVNPNHLCETLPYFQDIGITSTIYDPSRHKNVEKTYIFYRKELEDLTKKYGISKQQASICWILNHKKVITLIDPLYIKDLGERGEEFGIKFKLREIDQFYEVEKELEYDYSHWI